MEQEFNASSEILSMICAIGRTEDIRFSPSGRAIAIAGSLENRILVFEISFHEGGTVELCRGAEVVSPVLKNPHGLDFLDEERIIVANREGTAQIFRLPPFTERPCRHELLPIGAIPDGVETGVHTPGSVAAIPNEVGGHTVFICNNYTHTVTTHKLSAEGRLLTSNTLL